MSERLPNPKKVSRATRAIGALGLTLGLAGAAFGVTESTANRPIQNQLHAKANINTHRVAAMAVLAVAETHTSEPEVNLQRGITSVAVGNLQAYLSTSKDGDFFKYKGGYTDTFGPITQKALKKWQHATHNPVTGTIELNSTEWNELVRSTTLPEIPSGVEPVSVAAAVKYGWAINASKTPAVVKVLHYDSSTKTLTEPVSIGVAFGDLRGPEYVTEDGIFHIYAEEGPNFVSTEYDGAPMPYAAFFNGGDAFHYDELWASHGCVHIPSMATAEYIDSLPIGTTVVVSGQTA